MSISLGRQRPARPTNDGADPRSSLRWLLAAMVPAVLAIAMRGCLQTNENVSWLLDAAGRTLSGERPYVDILETNPPAAIGLYLTPVALSRLTGLSPEIVTDALLLLGFTVSILLSGSILRRAGLIPATTSGPLLAWATTVLLVVPGFVFAEREHIAVLALLPGLACLATRSHGAVPRRWTVLAAGLGLGIVLAIKPNFALGVAGGVAVLLVRRGPAAAIRSAELWIGAAVAVLYGLAVMLFVPSYLTNLMPVLLAVYLPARLPLFTLVWNEQNLMWAAALFLLGLMSRTRPLGPLVWVLVSASIGFELAYLQQGKGYRYHLYPAISLILLAAFLGVLQGWLQQSEDRADDPAPRRSFPYGLGLGLAVVLCVGEARRYATDIFDPFDYAPNVARAVEALGPGRKMLTISKRLHLGQPFARQLGDTWTGSEASAWVQSSSDDLVGSTGASQRAVQPFIDAEKAQFAADIRDKAPDVILVDGEAWQAWLDSSPILHAAMASYHRDRAADAEMTLWVRDGVEPAPPRSETGG